MRQHLLVCAGVFGLAWATNGIAENPTAEFLRGFEGSAEQAKTEAEGAKMSPAVQAVADRKMARSLVEYGVRTETPQAMVTGLMILHRNPFRVSVRKPNPPPPNPIEGLPNTVVADMGKWLKNYRDPDVEHPGYTPQAVADAIARADDGHILPLVDRPRFWKVRIGTGRFHEIEPHPEYAPHSRAVVTVYADPEVYLGISVRRDDRTRENVRAAGKGHVTAVWHTGISAATWDIRVHNLAGSDTREAEIRIERN